MIKILVDNILWNKVYPVRIRVVYFDLECDMTEYIKLIS